MVDRTRTIYLRRYDIFLKKTYDFFPVGLTITEESNVDFLKIKTLLWHFKFVSSRTLLKMNLVCFFFKKRMLVLFSVTDAQVNFLGSKSLRRDEYFFTFLTLR